MQSLSRKDNHRKSLMRNLATSMILYEKVVTTKAKAKELKSIIERIIAIAKKDNLTSRRQISRYLFDKKAVLKIFEVIVPRFRDMTSGYINIYKINNRLGDNSEVILLSFKQGKSPINYQINNEDIKNNKENNVSQKTKKTSQVTKKTKISRNKKS